MADSDQKLNARDHRRLGQDLDLFVMSDLVGSGLPMFTPRGTILRDELAKYANEVREKLGFEKVWSPHITKSDLYKTSGHWDKFGAELFLVKSQETKDQMVLKPMNCPHHIQIYASQPRSYRELPIKYLETTTDYRDEKSGELQGLSRVRSLTQDDSHVFCREEQAAQTIRELITATKELYKTLGMGLKARLSLRDNSQGYLGSKDSWRHSEELLEREIKAEKLEVATEKGDAAFYGPKIDFLAEDVMSRLWQVGTVQLDLVMPERFGLSYTNEKGESERPVIVHCAFLGSIERFLAVYIEHTDGKFPLWLAPEQLRVITVNDSPNTLKMAKNVVQKSKETGVRVYLDDSNETVGKKIAHAEKMKVPYAVVIGDKEARGGQITPRLRSDLGAGDKSYSVEELLKKISQDATTRRSV